MKISDLQLIGENDMMFDTITHFKDALMATIEELKAIIKFLKNELKERNIHIRTLLLWDANDRRKIDMSMLEKSKLLTTVETRHMLNSTLIPPSINTQIIDNTHEYSIINNDNLPAINKSQVVMEGNRNDNVNDSIINAFIDSSTNILSIDNTPERQDDLYEGDIESNIYFKRFDS